MRTEMEPLRQHLFAWMQHQDPPDHTRLRTLVSKAFTPRTVEGMRARNQALVDELIDAVQAQGRMDFSLDFAVLLPLISITELLGLPPDDRDDFHRWTLDITRFMEGIGPDFPGVARRAQQSVLKVHEYLRALFEQRRRQPEDDLISGLLAAEEEGDRLTEVELYGMCIFLLVAGHHTTKSLLTDGLLALLEHPDQLQRLKDDPALGKSAIEELLRYVSPIKFLSRYALRDFERSIRARGTIAFSAPTPTKIVRPKRPSHHERRPETVHQGYTPAPHARRSPALGPNVRALKISGWLTGIQDGLRSYLDLDFLVGPLQRIIPTKDPA